jgi:hypothetical protein
VREMSELLPCPFCGAGEFRIYDNTHWTGMRSVVVSVVLNHICIRSESGLQCDMGFKAKTKEDLIKIWNTRINE